MTRAVILAALLAAGPAWADDTLLMRESPEGHLAEVYYRNSERQSSGGVSRVYQHEGVEAHVEVRIGGADVRYAEIITVTPLDPGHVVLPEGPQEVMDGADFVFIITLPMF